MQPRRIARELALLSIGQLSTSTQLTESQEIEAAMTAAIRTLSEEVRETLESASADLNRSSDRILESEIKATDIASARAMLNDAIEMTQSAINRLGTTLELPEFIHISQSPEVREFAFSLIRTCRTRRADLDEVLTKALVDWQLSRLAKIDRNILRLAVAEICMLGTPDRVAINEAVELGKRYSTEEGHRFINGVLRRVTQNYKQPDTASPLDLSITESRIPEADTESLDLTPAVPTKRQSSSESSAVLDEASSLHTKPDGSDQVSPFVPPPVVAFPKEQFAAPPTIAEEHHSELEIQQIIPAPPKRVIPPPTKKRVIPAPVAHKKKRVIPAPIGRKNQKRGIPAPVTQRQGKQGVERPIVKTGDRPKPRHETAESQPPTPQSFEPSPSEIAMSQSGDLEPMASTPPLSLIADAAWSPSDSVASVPDMPQATPESSSLEPDFSAESESSSEGI